MIHENDAPTRREIKQELQSVSDNPANKGLSKSAMRLRQRDRLDTFLRGRGLGVHEIQALASDIDSYYPENFSSAGRQV